MHVVVFISTLLAMLAVACGVPQEDYDAVVLQLTEARSGAEQTTVELEALSDETAQNAIAWEAERKVFVDLVTTLTASETELEEQVQSLQKEGETFLSLIVGLENERIGLRDQASALEEVQASLTLLIGDLEVSEEQLTAELAIKAEQLADTTANYEVLLSEVGQWETVRSEREALVEQISSLQVQANGLQNEIASLEAQRAPLVVEAYINEFACTGSMEPKITCLDSATWLYNFNPEDIVIGAVILFTPTAACDLDASSVAHRVIDIRVEGGTYYYLPKGDASASHDGCWVPDTNVNGYIIDLHKGTHPENQALRNRVNSAKAAMEQAELDRDQADAARAQAYQGYLYKRIEYCGSATGSCTLLEPFYTEELSLLEAYESTYASYSNAHDAYVEAFDTYWQAIAEAKAQV